VKLKKFGLHDWKDFYHMNLLSHTPSNTPWQKPPSPLAERRHTHYLCQGYTN